MKHSILVVAAIAAACASTDLARAADETPAAIAPAPPASAPRPLPSEPALHHVPLTTAPEHTEVALHASIDRPDLVKRAVLVYRHGTTVDEAPFQRSALEHTPYVAVIPAEHVERPGIAYAIEIERVDGARVPVFAARDRMEPVEVVGDAVDVDEEMLDRRLGGRRFVVEANGEYVYFGSTSAPSGNVADYYWHTEAGFSYRLLRTVSEFGIRGGVYRGSSVVPNETDPSKYDVGLNYGAPWLRLRLLDWLHVEGEFLTSVTEVGFSVGGGFAALLGDEYGSHLTLGVEGVQVFGTRGYSRFDAVLGPRVRVAPMVEVTNMPHAPSAGVRLLTEFGFDVGAGFLLTVRGGYQARTFDSGGPAAGAGLAYAF